MVRLSDLNVELAGVSLSVTVIVKFDVPCVVGVPEMTPVDVLSVRPVGSVPVNAHVYGVTPPVAARPREYGSSSSPAFSGEVVAISNGNAGSMTS
jgi:hypothetical protein